jgi:uncharacterized protein YndB with AHSA1/START domain
VARRDVTVSRVLRADARLVWRALTERELLAEWLMPNDFVLEPGRPFTLRTDPAPGFDGVVRAEVLEVDPGRRMLWSWKGGPVDTVVEFRVEPLGDELTRVTVVQRGFRGLRAVVVSAVLQLGWWNLMRGPLPRCVARLAQAP